MPKTPHKSNFNLVNHHFGVPDGIIYCLHIGHSFSLVSHYLMHSLWNRCLHWNLWTISPDLSS